MYETCGRSGKCAVSDAVGFYYSDDLAAHANAAHAGQGHGNPNRNAEEKFEQASSWSVDGRICRYLRGKPRRISSSRIERDILTMYEYDSWGLHALHKFQG